jgi:hypothetical protein
LYQHRNSRKRPLLDDKVLTEWNAMMLATLSEAAFLFESDEWLQAAIRNGEFLVRELRTAQGNWHSSWQESGSPQARHRVLLLPTLLNSLMPSRDLAKQAAKHDGSPTRKRQPTKCSVNAGMQQWRIVHHTR